MTARVFVARDAGAISVGADEVAAELIAAGRRRGLEIDFVRTGSGGLYWAVPLIVVASAAGSVAYGPVAAKVVDGLLDAGLLVG
jgi:formate dehydrogenase iron-sulfur subunit